MSKRKNPVDEAIAYVMTQPLDAATTFVQTLASVVKARAASMPAKPAAHVATRAAAPKAAAKGPQRVTERAPGDPPAADGPLLGEPGVG